MVLLGLAAVSTGCATYSGDHGGSPLRCPVRAGLPNLPFPTLGGMQFWADLWVYAGWRIQENAFTAHCRLLDPSDVRLAWGSYADCRAAFEELRLRRPVRPPGTHRVLLLHGLGRTRRSMKALAAALGEAGYDAETVAYPSTRRGLAEHAIQLERLLDGLEGAEEVSFVTHSLGALVVRAALARDGDWKRRLRVGRMAMIAPPNRGSALASFLKDFPPYRWFTGPAGQDVVPGRVAKIPSPNCRFGILAGGGGGVGSRFIPGDDDGIVGVEETRLDGAEDFLRIDAGHTFMMEKPEVIRAVVNYLRTGRFRSTEFCGAAVIQCCR